MENRNGLVVNALVTQATGTAERDAALALVDKRSPHDDHGRRRQGLRHAEFVRTAGGAGHASRRAEHDEPIQRDRWPHHATCRLRDQPTEAEANRRDLRLVEDRGAAAEGTRHGVRRVGWMFTFAAAAYNLVRIRNLVEAAP